MPISTSPLFLPQPSLPLPHQTKLTSVPDSLDHRQPQLLAVCQRPSSQLTQEHKPSFGHTKMCIVYNRIHPSCGHQASGTSGHSSSTWICRNLFTCSGPQQQAEYISRGYCDMCIITGITVAKAKGFDMHVYARSMGVGIHDLMNAYPQWRP